MLSSLILMRFSSDDAYSEKSLESVAVVTYSVSPSSTASFVPSAMPLDAAFEKLQDSIIQAERTYRRSKNDYNGAVHHFNAFAQLIPFNLICRVSEMQTPQFFTAKDGLSSAE